MTLDDFEPVAHMYQHEDTGLVGFVDQYQLDNGFERLNPRLQVVAGLHSASQLQQLIDQINAKDADLAAAREEIELLKGEAICQGVESHSLRFSVEHFSKQLAARDLVIQQKDEALRDMLSGWIYIRGTYGDLYGVGWDRAQNKAEQALAPQPSQEALDAYVGERVAEEREGMQLLGTVMENGNVFWYGDEPNKFPLRTTIYAIRARKDKP